MKILKEFPFAPDKERTLRAIDCPFGSPLYYKASDCFDRLEKKFYNTVLPKAAYCIETNIDAFDFLPDGSQGIYVLYTLGDQIDSEISCCFQSGNYFDGMLISAMCDVYLFQMQEWLYDYLTEMCGKRGLQISSCFMPFDDIASSYQQQIVDKLSIGVSLTSADMLQPIKSASFIVGTGKKLPVYEGQRIRCESCRQDSCRGRFDGLSFKM